MSRKKIKLAYITNDSARKTTYKKRSKGQVKKVRELTTLCGIEAFAIINSPDFGSQAELSQRYSTALETARGELPEGVEQSPVRKPEWKWDIAEFEYDGFE
ncbi:agamous-like MADS-box protein AGL80 [Gossypium australe]|uniref:Agamous-like MADS-box protein AGL80 n=1 Tax=Gossypium australe TaxID=47621 RepID=A0A5B6WZX4_9ROSI|nr:agamous-like MADS-box protein AGL80 [Gossypium australe]